MDEDNNLTGGVFKLSDPINNAANPKISDQEKNNFYQHSDLDQNQLTTNSEDLRQLSKEVKEFVVNNPSYLRVKNEVKRNSLSSKDESLSIYDQTEEFQRNAITLEVNKEQEFTLTSVDDKWGWIVVFGSILCMIVVDGICFTLGMHNESITSHFAITSLSLTILPSSVLSGIYLITSPLANPMAHYLGYRTVAMLGSVCTTVSLIISSHCTSYVSFVIFFGVLPGIGFGLMYLPAIAIVAHWFNNQRAVAIGIALCGSGIGTCIFSFLMPCLIDWVQWRGSLIILSACCCQSLVGIALFRPYEIHQRLVRMKSAYKQWCLRNQDLIKERKRVRKENKRSLSMQKEQRRREKLAKTRKIVIQRGSIFTRIMEEKSRQRTVSTGSLDGMMITQLNQLVKASQVDMNRMLFNQMNSSCATMCSESSVPNSLLQSSAIDRVVEATLRVLKASTRNITNVVKGKTPSAPVSKKSSANSISDMISNTDNVYGDIPIQLVQEYVAKQRSHNKEENGKNPSFKVGSTSLISTEDGQAKTINLENSDTSINSHKVKQHNETSDVSSERNSSRMQYELPNEIKHVIRTELMKELASPISRKDLYFSGSLHNFINSKNVNVRYRSNSLANFNKSNISSCRYSCPIMDSETKTNIVEDNDPPVTIPSNMQTSWILEIFDLNIMRSCAFQCLILSSVAMMLGFFVPFYFLPIMLNKESIYWTSGALFVLGISNIAGRLAATLYIEKGWAMKYRRVNGVNLTIMFLTVAGVSVLLIPYAYMVHVGLVLVLALIYGFCIAMIVSIRSMLVVELFGVENLTKTFTFLLLFQGVAAVIGPVLAGFVCDNILLGRNTSEPAFLFSGILYLLSALSASLLTQSSSLCCESREETSKSKRHRALFAGTSGRNSVTDDEGYNHQTTQTTNIIVPMHRREDSSTLMDDHVKGRIVS